MLVTTSARLGKTLPTRVNELTPGLLVFCDRPSRLQSWAQAFGVEWRHVGMTVQVDGTVMLAGYGRKGKYSYIPLEKLANYRRIAVARVFDNEEQIAAFNGWCRSYENLDSDELRYTTSGTLVGPLLQVSRVHDPGVVRRGARRFAYRYCQRQSTRYENEHAYACSTFVRAAVDAARDVPLRLPVTSHPEDLAAYAESATHEERELARWLCSPADLWDTTPEWDRAELELCDDSFIGLPALVEPAPPPEPQPSTSATVAVGALTQVAMWLRLSTLLVKKLHATST